MSLITPSSSSKLDEDDLFDFGNSNSGDFRLPLSPEKRFHHDIEDDDVGSFAAEEEEEPSSFSENLLGYESSSGSSSSSSDDSEEEDSGHDDAIPSKFASLNSSINSDKDKFSFSNEEEEPSISLFGDGSSSSNIALSPQPRMRKNKVGSGEFPAYNYHSPRATRGNTTRQINSPYLYDRGDAINASLRELPDIEEKQSGESEDDSTMGPNGEDSISRLLDNSDSINCNASSSLNKSEPFFELEGDDVDDDDNRHHPESPTSPNDRSVEGNFTTINRNNPLESMREMNDHLWNSSDESLPLFEENPDVETMEEIAPRRRRSRRRKDNDVGDGDDDSEEHDQLNFSSESFPIFERQKEGSDGESEEGNGDDGNSDSSGDGDSHEEGSSSESESMDENEGSNNDTSSKEGQTIPMPQSPPSLPAAIERFCNDGTEPTSCPRLHSVSPMLSVFQCQKLQPHVSSPLLDQARLHCRSIFQVSESVEPTGQPMQLEDESSDSKIQVL